MTKIRIIPSIGANLRHMCCAVSVVRKQNMRIWQIQIKQIHLHMFWSNLHIWDHHQQWSQFIAGPFFSRPPGSGGEEALVGSPDHQKMFLYRYRLTASLHPCFHPSFNSPRMKSVSLRISCVILVSDGATRSPDLKSETESTLHIL